METYPEEIQKIFKNRLKDENTDLNLYHYTDLNSLCSMLTNKSIWFTYIRHSNDGGEFVHGLNLFLDIYTSRKEEFPYFADNFINFLNREVNPTYKPYILCLSEVGDSLGQWRGYSNFGKGVSIKVNPNLIPQTGHHILKKVIYNHEKKVEACNDLLQDIKTLFNKSFKLSSEDVEELFALVIGLIFTLVSTFKAESFEEEKEWRWIFFPNPKVYRPQIRVKNNDRLLLYCEQEFDPNHFELITIGPDSSRPTITQSTLEELARFNKYTYEIRNSLLSFYN